MGHDKQLTMKELIQLWHSDSSVDEIASAYKISRNEILVAWRRLKVVGELPTGDRPRSRQSFILRGDSLADGRPSIASDDPLLDALKAGKR